MEFFNEYNFILLQMYKCDDKNSIRMHPVQCVGKSSSVLCHHTCCGPFPPALAVTDPPGPEVSGDCCLQLLSYSLKTSSRSGYSEQFARPTWNQRTGPVGSNLSSSVVPVSIYEKLPLLKQFFQQKVKIFQNCMCKYFFWFEMTVEIVSLPECRIQPQL